MDQISSLEISNIRPSNVKLRPLSEEAVADLVKSIKASGLLQPIMVRPLEKGYEVIFGTHRLEACRRLGWKAVPAVVRKMSEEEANLTQIVENIQRNHIINPIEEARVYKELLKKGWTVSEIAKALAKSDSYVYDRMTLLDRLDPKIAREVAAKPDGRITTSHAVRLAYLENLSDQRELSRVVKKARLSVHQLERLVKLYRSRNQSDSDLDALAKLYEIHNLETWKNGFFRSPDSRVCVLRSESFDLITIGLKTNAYDIGRQCGKSMSDNLTKTTREKISRKKKIVEFNLRTGWGKAILENSILALQNPATSNEEFVRGYFETYLNVRLKTLRSDKEWQRFRVVRTYSKN
jgi:ParB/RepB/Spo0J family partition protein